MRNKKQIIMLSIIVLGIFLRVFKLPSQGIWTGEYITAALASGNSLLQVFFNSIENTSQPPLFFMLEHVVLKIFGVSELSARLLPALIGIINIFLFYRLARSFFNEKSSVIAMFLFSLNPYQIYYSQENGPQGLFLMTSMLIIYYFLMSIKYSSFLFQPFTAWSIIGLYSYNHVFLLLLVMNFIILVTNRRDIRLDQWLKAQGIIFAAWLPLALLSIKAAGPEWPAKQANMLLAPVYSLKDMFFGASAVFNWATITALFVCLAFTVLGVISKRKATEKRLLDVISIIILMSILVPWLRYITGTASYSESYFIAAAALIIIITAVGVSYMSDQGLTAFMVIITAIYCISLFNYYFMPKYQKISYRELFKKVSSEMRPGDAVLHTSENSFSAFEFYNTLAFKTDFPDRLLGEAPGYPDKGSDAPVRRGRKGLREWFEDSLKINVHDISGGSRLGQEELKKSIPGYRRVWLITDNAVGIKQMFLPEGNLWNSKADFGQPPEQGKIWWVKEYFHTVRQEKGAFTDLTLLERD